MSYNLDSNQNNQNNQNKNNKSSTFNISKTSTVLKSTMILVLDIKKE